MLVISKDKVCLFFILFTIIFLSTTTFAQYTISRINPQGERGASYIQVITVEHTMTATFNDTTEVNVTGLPTITWLSINNWSSGLTTSLHNGRITIPHDIPLGTYQIVLRNDQFFTTCNCGRGWLVISDFSVSVSAASQSEINIGSMNVPVTMTLSTSLPDWQKYSITSVVSTLSGVSIVPGSPRFISQNQITMSFNVDQNATIGSMGLYIQYGFSGSAKKINLAKQKGVQSLRRVPTTYGDFSTIYLDSANSILNVGEANPTITSITPSNISIGENNVLITITGLNFAPGMVLSTNQPGIVFSNTQFISETQALSYVTISSNANLGDTAITVTNPDGRSSTNHKAFRIVSKRPNIISVSNPLLVIGQTGQQVCISGENFYPGASIVFYSDYVHAREVRVINSTTICMLVDIDAVAQPGNIGVAVFNPDGAYDDEQNAFVLSLSNIADKTILLLYPGVVGGLPFAINETELNPVELIDTQYPVFRWFSTAWRFRISIYKPLPGQASYAEVVRNQPYYEQIVDGVNYFQYPLAARTLEPGVRYYWKVTAYFGTVPAEYYNADVDIKNLDDTTFQGERLESEVWSFVVRSNRTETRDELRFGTLNPVSEISIEPRYVEVTPGDRLILELRGYDLNHELAAFVPDMNMLNYGEMERRYPDVKVLPKSFGRAELVVPGVKGNDDFRTRLLRNPAEFGRLPILLYISKKAKGVCAVLAVWQNYKFYAFVNVLPPKASILENGQIDRFRIGSAERLAETFEIELDSPVAAGSVINGSGRLFIDAAGFREKGFFPVNIEDVRVDPSGRAYTGKVIYEGAVSLSLPNFDVEIHKIDIYPDRQSAIHGGIALPTGEDDYRLGFEGKLNAFGDFNALAKIEKSLTIKGSKLSEGSTVEVDFDVNWSPEFKKYDPAFRGLIVTLENEDGKTRRVPMRTSDDLSSAKTSEAELASVKTIDISKYSSAAGNSEPEIFLTAKRADDGKIDLSWISKNADSRFFNIYRRSEGESRYRLIAEKAVGEKFIDKYVFQEGIYWYKVFEVKSNNEERGSSEAVKIE